MTPVEEISMKLFEEMNLLSDEETDESDQEYLPNYLNSKNPVHFGHSNWKMMKPRKFQGYVGYPSPPPSVESGLSKIDTDLSPLSAMGDNESAVGSSSGNTRVSSRLSASSTQDDAEYRSKRDRNNAAVKKCRMKKKLQQEEMEIRFRMVVAENEKLRNLVRDLKDESEFERKKNQYLSQLIKEKWSGKSGTDNDNNVSE